MLFNSVVFIFLYLPIVVIFYYVLGAFRHNFAMLWLTAGSIFFYGWWNSSYVFLLLGSIAFNYFFGILIIQSTLVGKIAKVLLVVAIGGNISLLAYYKYANFFIDNINYITGSQYLLRQMILPLGISFFTFTQIAFLVDAYQGKLKEFNFIHYTLFVTYFPHLIAGPILHHKEMMSQFDKPNVCRIDWDNMATGMTIFVIGLAKKVLLADNLAEYANPIFTAVKSGIQPMFGDAWIGALAYTFQLYFDFSGYCDMAIGLSLLFNVRMPINFNSPYKATSIIEFWRRWHMSLSRFLRDYLYIPLGGNRGGNTRRYINLLITMLLGGLWHGAGWTFLIWGGLHGAYLIINHAWRALMEKFLLGTSGFFYTNFSRFVTFLAVVVGWVFFRADNLDSALTMLGGMSGMHGISLSASLADTEVGNYLQQHLHGVAFHNFHFIGKPIHVIELIIVILIIWVLPNTLQFTARFSPVINTEQIVAKSSYPSWQPAIWYALLILIAFLYSIDCLYKPSTFLYYQF